uniref:URB1 ribosome biosis homolog n=1 Tax=Ficedula albicollis TaxID=59894 RepID=A0A803V723_FICAL
GGGSGAAAAGDGARGPGPAPQGLETFVSVAKTLPSPQVYDVVEGYVKISMECAEIFKLLDGERKPESEMLLIFQALEAILLRTASDLSHFSVVGMNIVKKLIHSYMKLVYAALYSENYTMSRGCLTLLSAMVAQGPDSARDVYSHFDFNNKYLPGLLTKGFKKGRTDVRMAYIQFALSFLIAGDNALLAQVLELKDFIPGILRSEIKEDRVSTVNLLLSTLRTKVVHNKNISKTQKVRFFTAEVLLHIASLYRWNGITDVSPEDLKVAQGSEEVGKAMVRELVHSFLMDLCCSLKHGITFYDPSLGTSGKGGNVVLLHFLLGLKTAAEDEMVADLLVNILKVCPDLLNRYFKETHYSFVPRVAPAWMDNVKLLKKIYEAQPDISNCFKTSEFIPLPRLLSMVMVTTVPAVCNKTMLSKGLNKNSIVVKHSILSLVSMVLRRALRNIEHCLCEETWRRSQIYTLPAVQEFVQLYREAVSKVLPDVNNLVAVWQSLLKQKGEHTDGPAEEKEDDAEMLLLKAALLQVICLYQKVVPHLVARSNFDFSKLLKGVVTEKRLREEVPPLLQHHILKVALELPANKFAWFRVQGISETEKIPGEKSVFYLLMKMFVTTTHSHLKISTKKLIIKVLCDSGVFEYTWKELSIWLEHLDKTKEDQKEAVIQFLERILLKLVTNPYTYTDKAADLVQEASVLQVAVFKQDSDNISIPVSHIDDVLDMVDVLIEGSDGFDEEIGFSLNEDMIIQTFPFSAVVPAALEARNILLLQSENGTGTVFLYLVAVFTELLHSQREPLALCLMFQLYDKDLESLEVAKYPQLYQFNQYYKLWIPKQSQESRGSKTLLEGGVQTKLRDLASWLPPDQLLLGVKHVLLYLKSTVENFSSVRTLEDTLTLIFRHPTLESWFLALELRSIPQPGLNPVTVKLLSRHPTLESWFRHPTLESWFLALELRSIPQPGLNPVTVKLLSAHLNSGVLQLLKTGAPILQSITTDHRHVLSRYFEAITKSVLEELQTVGKDRSQVCPRKSHQLQALEELHVYMTAAQLKEITLTMLQLPENSLTSQKSEKSPKIGKQQLSFCGQILVQLFTDSYQRHPQQGELLLSAEHVTALGELMPASASKDLERVFLQALQSEPVLALAGGVEVQAHCLAQCSHTSLATAAMLIQHSRTHLLQLELWCLSTATGKYLRKYMDSFLPLIHVYLQCRDLYGFSRPSAVVSAVTPVLRKALWKELCAGIQDAGASHEASEKLQILSKLLPPLESKELHNLMDQLPAALEKAGNGERWAVCACLPQGTFVLGTTLFATCKAWLAKPHKKLVPSLALTCQVVVPLTLWEQCVVEEVDPGDWCSLVKTGLKYRYRDETFLKVLNVAIQLLYKKESSLSQSLVRLSKIHMMVTQHSLFLSTILRSVEEDGTKIHTRESLYKDGTVKSLDDFYDPCFLLQLFSELTRPECVVACHKFVEVNALGLTVAALSSYDPNMRAAAYFVLASFRSHLEGARFREKSQLLYLLDAVQNGIKQPNLRVTFSLTLYIARVAQQMLKPEEHMYIKVNRFLLSHQYLDLRKVPDFFQLFYSFDFEYKTEREWILRFLGEGLRDKHCYELYDYQRIFQIILSFFNSPLCDGGSQSRILEILQSAARVTRAAYELIQDHSLLTWLLHSLEKRFLENKVINKIISLLHTLWLTNLGDKRENKNQSQEKRKLLPIQLVNEFLYVLVTLIKHIGTNVDVAKLTEFFSTFSSVLEYRAVVVEAFREMRRFMANDSVLSSRDLLLLLHKWSLVSKDLQLQEELQALAWKCQNKELLKNVKDKNKPQASSHVYRHTGKKNEVEEDDAAADMEVSELEKCREHLNSILVHWDPVFPAAPCTRGGETLRASEGGGEAVAVTCASIHVVTKWLVRSLAGQSLLREQDVSPALRWLQNRVLPHLAAAWEVLGDETLRNNLFKLYSRLCQASSSSAGLSRELGVLGSIMLQLMEEQGPSSTFHELVKSLCLSATTEEDADRRAVSVFLTSVYIGDMWLGAQQPDMLLTHVRLVCTSAGGELQDGLGTPKQGEEPIVSLCKKIWLHQGINSGH